MFSSKFLFIIHSPLKRGVTLKRDGARIKMFGKKNSESEILKSTLKECDLFNGFSSGDLKSLLEISHIRDYSEGEAVFTQSTVGLCFYLIVKGSVNIVTENQASRQILKKLSQGEYFSEVHLFSENVHSVTAEAAELTRLIVFAKPDFEDLVKKEPKLGNKTLLRFLEYFGLKLDELYRENRELKTKLMKND